MNGTNCMSTSMIKKNGSLLSLFTHRGCHWSSSLGKQVISLSRSSARGSPESNVVVFFVENIGTISINIFVVINKMICTCAQLANMWDLYIYFLLIVAGLEVTCSCAGRNFFFHPLHHFFIPFVQCTMSSGLFFCYRKWFSRLFTGHVRIGHDGRPRTWLIA